LVCWWFLAGTDDDYEPSEVTDGGEQKDKEVPKTDVAAIVEDKEEVKNKGEVVDKKEDQDKIKGPTEVINQGKEGDDEDDLVIIDGADQSIKKDKKADKVFDFEASAVEQQKVSPESLKKRRSWTSSRMTKRKGKLTRSQKEFTSSRWSSTLPLQRLSVLLPPRQNPRTIPSRLIRTKSPACLPQSPPARST
jgi:hypothetical protein